MSRACKRRLVQFKRRWNQGSGQLHLRWSRPRHNPHRHRRTQALRLRLRCLSLTAVTLRSLLPWSGRSESKRPRRRGRLPSERRWQQANRSTSPHRGLDPSPIRCRLETRQPEQRTQHQVLRRQRLCSSSTRKSRPDRRRLHLRPKLVVQVQRHAARDRRSSPSTSRMTRMPTPRTLATRTTCRVTHLGHRRAPNDNGTTQAGVGSSAPALAILAQSSFLQISRHNRVPSPSLLTEDIELLPHLMDGADGHWAKVSTIPPTLGTVK